MKFKLTIEDKPVRSKISVNITRLSYITGYHKSHISRIFAQRNEPSVACLKKMALALGMGWEELHIAIKERRINVAKR